MPYDDPDPDDPHVLVGVSLPGDEATTREMADAFADEFARLGFDRDAHRCGCSANPFYAGAHRGLAAPRRRRDRRASCEESLRVYGGRSARSWTRPRATTRRTCRQALRGKRALRVL